MLPVAKIKAAEWNYKQRGTVAAREKLKRSIMRDKTAGVIAVRDLGGGFFEAVDGNHRLEAIQDLGWEEVACENFGQITLAAAVTIASRRNHEWFIDKSGALDGLLREVVLPEIKLSELAEFMPQSHEELERLLEPDVVGDDEIPDVPAVPVAKMGDAWMLGDHILLCGDSTDREQVDRLMKLGGGARATMCHMDPPYNVAYGSTKNPKHKIREIANDSMDTAAWEVFCKAFQANVHAWTDGDIYMWGASGPDGERMRLWLIDAGCHWSATIVWGKDALVLTPANYQRQYEPCFYGWFGKSSYRGDRKQSELWSFKRPTSSKKHPTMKPVDLCAQAVRNSSGPGDVVIDVFGGSGSTLMACERLGRRARTMELDPGYCDVIIERWEKATGRKAESLTGA